MAHVWTRKNEQWFAVAMENSAYALTAAGCDPCSENLSENACALIRRCGDESRDPWALLAPPAAEVRVNAEPLELGLRVLRDRDEITIPRSQCNVSVARYYFSTEAVPVVQSMPDGSTGVCPRCRAPIGAGKNAVRCPLCGVFHHQDETDGNCWTYDAVCANCRHQPTSLDGHLQWTPELI